MSPCLIIGCSRLYNHKLFVVILLVAIGAYIFYWWLFVLIYSIGGYSCLYILLMAIGGYILYWWLLVHIYSIGGYWCLYILLVVIISYSINGY